MLGGEAKRRVKIPKGRLRGQREIERSKGARSNTKSQGFSRENF